MTALNFGEDFNFSIGINHHDHLPDAAHHSHTHATPGKPPPRKRRRIVISCTECHRRKQKCDRKLPCTNCISRQKQDECEYDSAAPTAKEQQQHQQPKRARRTSSNGAYLTPELGLNGITDNITEKQWPKKTSPNYNHDQNLPSNVTNVANLGYSTTAASTSMLGFLHKIENHSNSSSSPSSSTAKNHNHNIPSTSTDHLNARERYRSLIRQLPQRLYVEKLVDVYFRDFNWQYFMLDRDIFDNQLEEWYKMPFEVFSNGGPGAILPDLRVFPALLFQVVAVTMLVLPEEADTMGREAVVAGSVDGKGRGEEHESCRSKGITSRGDDGVDFEALKYAGNMTFEDLSKEYSEAGVAILSLLGKRQMTLTTVLAGFVRASFLKFAGMVPEAWHAIGTAIRDAQELGLHRSSLDPRPPPSATAEAILENQWDIQRRRKVWLNLVSWDIHCGATLGRPSNIDLTTDPPILPIDAVLPTTNIHSPIPIIPRTKDDPPTPLTRILFIFRITLHLTSILLLEREGPSPSSFAKVDALHQQLLSLEQSIPSFFRLQNPDTRFDSFSPCHWLPWARALLHQLISFNFMALHRPYIFTRPLSRRLAVERGCLDMLKAQKRHWELLTREMRRRTFTLFFGTFDAVVLMGAVYILFGSPTTEEELKEGKEKGMVGQEMVREVVRQFMWAEERFEEMKERNPLARQARGVVRGIGERLWRALREAGAEWRDTALSRDEVLGVKPPAVGITGGGRRLAKQQRLVKPVTSIPNGLSPACSTSGPPGILSRVTGSSTTTPAGASSATPGFPTPVSITPSYLVQAQFGTTESNNSVNNNCFGDTFIFGTLSEPIPIDPSLNSVPAPVLSPGTGIDWATASALPSTMSLQSLPEDLYWADISPLYATGDLVYNDLTGFVSNRLGSVITGGGRQDYSRENDDGGGGFGNELGQMTDTHTPVDTRNEGVGDAENSGMVKLTRLEYNDSQEQSEPLWMFDGRIDDGSVWGLLNWY